MTSSFPRKMQRAGFDLDWLVELSGKIEFFDHATFFERIGRGGFKEKARGSQAQIVACPGPLAAPRRLQAIDFSFSYSPNQLWQPTYMASQENVVVKAPIEVFLQSSTDCKEEVFLFYNQQSLFCHLLRRQRPWCSWWTPSWTSCSSRGASSGPRRAGSRRSTSRIWSGGMIGMNVIIRFDQDAVKMW